MVAVPFLFGMKSIMLPDKWVSSQTEEEKPDSGPGIMLFGINSISNLKGGEGTRPFYTFPQKVEKQSASLQC